MSSIVSQDYFGFGDNIYKRPFIKALSKQFDEVFVYTSFPELFSDIKNVKFCRPITALKTQSEWIKYHVNKGTYGPDQSHARNKVRLNYGANFKLGKNILDSFSDYIHISDYRLDIPEISVGKNKALEVYNSIPKDRKLCIVRLPSVRTEWKCETRNPKMEYFNTLMKAYKNEYYFLSIGDIDDTERFSEKPDLSLIDFKYHSKQLNLYETLNLIKLADLTISIPCFVLPLAIALHTPAFFIYGGYVRHELLVHPKLDTSNIEYIEPNPFCNCIRNEHNCNKEIDKTELLNKFENFIRRL